MFKQVHEDLTTGPIIKKLILFFIPIAAGTLFQQLYNAADALIVSKFLGTNALAAVGGSPAVIINLIVGFCTALCAGAAVVIAHIFGAKNDDCMSAALQVAYWFAIILGLLIGIVVFIFSPQILILMKTPKDTIADALLYQRIYFCSCVFVLIYNMGASLLRALGNSQFPFICLLVSCVTNIVLDFVFVVFFNWGVAGVAWATVIAIIISAVLVTIKLMLPGNKYRLSLRVPNSRMHWSLLKDMLTIGIPSGIQSSMYGISNMVLQIGINTLDTIVVASWTMTEKVDGAYWAIASAFGSAITTFIGQNYGANKMNRVKEASKNGLRLFFTMTVCCSILILISAYPLLKFFTSDSAVVQTTWKMLWFFVPFYFLWSVIETYTGVLRGVGDTLGPTLILIFCICAFRIIWLVTVFHTFPTMETISISYPISWVISDIALIFYFRKKSIISRQNI